MLNFHNVTMLNIFYPKTHSDCIRISLVAPRICKAIKNLPSKFRHCILLLFIVPFVFSTTGSIIVTFDLTNGANAMNQVNILKGRVENNAMNMTIGGDTLIVSTRNIVVEGDTLTVIIINITTGGDTFTKIIKNVHCKDDEYQHRGNTLSVWMLPSVATVIV